MQQGSKTALAGAAGQPNGARSASLAHLPRGGRRLFFDDTFAIVRDPRGFTEARARRHGPVFAIRFLGVQSAFLLGPEANELVFFDRAGAFAAAPGYAPFLGRVFPRGVLMMDFDEHRLHRRALNVAFKAGALRAYFERLDAGVAAWLERWTPGVREVYPEMKRMTLALAAETFLGMRPGPEADAVNRAFVAEIAATIGLVRAPLPLTAMGRGVRARAWLVDYLVRQIPARREGAGDDLFSELCRATLDERPLTAEEIADHMNFLLMAAHDTLASSFSALIFRLAVHPDWRRKLREEAFGLGLRPSEPTPYEALDKLKLADMAFKETLRLTPPSMAAPRIAVRDFAYRGFQIPAGARVAAVPLFTHYMPEIWPEPTAFDPMRFTEAQQAERHRFAFVPFGGGAHMCIGLNYAQMQARCFIRHLIQRFDFQLATGYTPSWRSLPIPTPSGGLPVEFKPI